MVGEGQQKLEILEGDTEERLGDHFSVRGDGQEEAGLIPKCVGFLKSPL